MFGCFVVVDNKLSTFKPPAEVCQCKSGELTDLHILVTVRAYRSSYLSPLQIFTHINRDTSCEQGLTDKMAAQVTLCLARFPSIRHVYALVLASAEFRRSRAYLSALASRIDLAPLGH